MAWRTVLIQKAAKLALAKGQLHLSNEEGVFTLPLPHRKTRTNIAKPCPKGSIPSPVIANEVKRPRKNSDGKKILDCHAVLQTARKDGVGVSSLHCRIINAS